MTTIDELPFTVLEKILSYAWHYPTLIRVAEASLKIAYLLRERMELQFITTHTNMKVHPCKWRESYVWIQGREDVRTYLRDGATIKTLVLNRVIGVQDYNTLGERFGNLHVLDITWINLEIFQKVGTWANFPKLTELCLGGPRHVGRWQISDYSSKEVMNNISGLIAFLGRENYPKLEKLTLSIIFVERRENCLLDSILTFLSRHLKTLDTLIIMMAHSPYEYSGVHIEDWLTVPNFDARLGSLLLTLRHLFVYFYPYYESEKFHQLIDQVSRTQGSIESHVVLYPRFAAFYTDILEDNFRTLTDVAFNMWIFYTLDCQVFEQCSVLRVLILHARPKKLEELEKENYRGEAANSELVNIERLPKSLTYIQVVNFFILTKDAAKFTTELPQLECLSLQGIGEKENLGFTLDMFSLLVRRGVEVEVYRGFNQQSIQESQGSDNAAVAFTTLCLLKDEPLSDKPNLLSLSWAPPLENRNGSELGECSRNPVEITVDFYERIRCSNIPFDHGIPQYKIYQEEED